VLGIGLACLGLAAPGGAAAPSGLVVRVKAPESDNDRRDDYFRDMLVLALSKTAAEGPWRIDVGAPANQARAVENLKAGRLDVIWTLPTAEREAEMRPVRIPLEKGLLGYRVFLIRAGDAARFAAIASLDPLTAIDGLKALRAGQGKDWNSTRVMEAAGFKVDTAASYDSLFLMLREGRIDYFPRGLNEAWAELAARPDSGLTVESTLLLRYPAASYFWVQRDTGDELAGRIERGLGLALADGSFDALLLGHPTHRELFALARPGQRRILAIANPMLPSTAPLDRPELWRIPGLPAPPVPVPVP
jgi:hypothetical protein